MSLTLLPIVACVAIILIIAYYTYGPLLSRLLKLDPDVKTPAYEFQDDVDYVPCETKSLLSQHFSAIAAAGPIVGPIAAGLIFGWVPALIWIVVGAIFIGGVHDMTSLVASIRHKARSIAEVVRDNMSRRSYILFLAFVWLALVYIIVAFTDVTSSSFLGAMQSDGYLGINLGNDQIVRGGGVATSSLLYLLLPLTMGLLMKYADLSIGWATIIFLPLVGVSIWVGQFIPLDFSALFDVSPSTAQLIWNVILLVYCVVASVVPMWLLLQPRGHLGGYFLYAVLAAGALGILFGNFAINYPAFRGFEAEGKGGLPVPLFPMLFITIACGACSGFHSIIASGTTSKQLEKETDAQPVGYGSMLLEAMVAVISLCCVMMLVPDGKDPLTQPGADPNVVYAKGISNFLNVFGIPIAFGVSFGLMAFTTFVYDTLDVCTRLGRYILQELTGLEGAAGTWLGTMLTAGVPLIFLVIQGIDFSAPPAPAAATVAAATATTAGAAVANPASPPKKMPAWQLYWNVFGASNQLLAALTLLGVTVWLWRTYRHWWVLVVTGIPCVLMYTMSMWALFMIVSPLASAVFSGTWVFAGFTPVPYIATVLSVLGLLLLIEAIFVIGGNIPPPADEKGPALAAQ